MENALEYLPLVGEFLILQLMQNQKMSKKSFWPRCIDCERATKEIIPRHWRKEAKTSSSMDNDITPVSALRGLRLSKDALHMRDCLKEYTNSNVGSLSWQLDYVRRT